MAKANKKNIYRIQHQHDMPGSYYYTQRQADRAWADAEEPLSYDVIDPVVACEKFERELEDKDREITNLAYRIMELLWRIPTGMFLDCQEARDALDAVRPHQKADAEDMDRFIAELKEKRAAEKESKPKE